MSKNNKQGFGLSLRGLAMGIAEVIPGVSGGTIAFITGIYEELIDTIKGVNFSLVPLLLGGKFKQFWAEINGRFLLFLLVGMGIGVVIGIFFVTYLLEQFPEPLWGFFFGLVLASGIYIARQIEQIKWQHFVFMIIGAAFSYMVTQLTPAGGTEALWFVFLSGAIAISALILPGISGSFILLLMGMYSIVIPHVKSLLSEPNSESFIIVAVFALGCLTGLFSFARVLSYAFKNFKNTTFALLTGIMLGSLAKIWPWRNPTLAYDKISDSNLVPDLSSFQLADLQELKILQESNVFPSEYFSAPHTLITIGAFLIGLVLIFVADRYQDN